MPRTAMRKRPWYSDPSIKRDRSQVLESPKEVILGPGSRFLVFFGRGVLHCQESGGVAAPLYLTRQQVDAILQKREGDSTMHVENLLTTQEETADESTTAKNNPILAWVGNHEGIDYWALRMEVGGRGESDRNIIMEVLEQELQLVNAKVLPLREFGDSLDASSTMDAGLLATAQGLMEFHASHRFCSRCGARMVLAKAGACCKCISCSRVVYPRLDVASIMLITHKSTHHTEDKEYCLLGRKAMWPAGRYSTLAGFAEVGETLEDCCVREVWEESGVRVDPASVRFIASQPWPFPQSLMVGFHAEAVTNNANDESSTLSLPRITIDQDEMEDIQWFSKDYVRQRLDGGSTALQTYEPNGKERDFHIPGRASLARLLITEWALDGNDHGDNDTSPDA